MRQHVGGGKLAKDPGAASGGWLGEVQSLGVDAQPVFAGGAKKALGIDRAA